MSTPPPAEVVCRILREKIGYVTLEPSGDSFWLVIDGSDRLTVDEAAAFQQAVLGPRTLDARGTCHLVGCPSKGQHPPHGIGAGTWQDYTQPAQCLGYPKISAGFELIQITCSLDGPWNATPRLTLCPADMAQLVDEHKAECTNRRAR